MRHCFGALLDSWQRFGDGRARYLTWYARISEDTLAAADQNRFADPAWMRRMVEQLSDHYLITVAPAGDDLTLVTPPAWRAAHQVAARNQVSATQAIRLGVNAHVSNDLPRAAATLLLADWPMGNVKLERRYQDLCIYADAVGAAAGMPEELTAWRAECWERALALTTAADARWRDAVGEDIECTAARRAHLIACDIPMRDHLLRLTGAELHRRFPPRHLGADCRLTESPPSWDSGRVAEAAF
jgi:hypothetical protein